MWEISISNQITTFLLSVLIGMVFCLIYDMGRIIRTRYFLGTVAVFITDVLYFIFIGIFEFCFFLVTCSGEIRSFVFIGNLLGFVLCRATLSKVFVPFGIFMLACLHKVFSLFERILIKPISKKHKNAKIFIKTALKKRFFRKKVLKND